MDLSDAERNQAERRPHATTRQTSGWCTVAHVLLAFGLVGVPAAGHARADHFPGNDSPRLCLAERSPTSLPAKMREDSRVRAWWQVMVWGVVLLVILVFATAAIIVFSRRYAAYLATRRSKPTVVDDVWSMHASPDLDDDGHGGGGDVA